MLVQRSSVNQSNLSSSSRSNCLTKLAFPVSAVQTGPLPLCCGLPQGGATAPAKPLGQGWHAAKGPVPIFKNSFLQDRVDGDSVAVSVPRVACATKLCTQLPVSEELPVLCTNLLPSLLNQDPSQLTSASSSKDQTPVLAKQSFRLHNSARQPAPPQRLLSELSRTTNSLDYLYDKSFRSQKASTIVTNGAVIANDKTNIALNSYTVNDVFTSEAQSSATQDATGVSHTAAHTVVERTG